MKAERAPTKPKADARSRRNLLLDAARAVFFEDGYQKASMREVARRAGMTQAAIYYHFTDKEDLLFTLINDFTDRFATILMGAVASVQSQQDKLSSLISAHLNLLVENTKDLKILSHDRSHLSDERVRVIRSKEKMVLTVYRACLEEMRKTGCLADIDSTVASFSIIGTINWIYHWYRPEGGLPWEAVRQSILKQVLHGVCAPQMGQAIARVTKKDQVSQRRIRQ